MDRVSAARRVRGAQESLASVVLGFESVVVFLGGLVVYGLRAVPTGVEPWWGIVAGSILAVAAVVIAGTVRHRWGIALGWALQAVIALGAILVPALGAVALVFGALYAYATIKGGELDRRNARRAADTTNGE